ncbi:copper chaperone for superoxide dismutase, chloroplastic [Phalaenopsis equestris]|uniref:copper chaperone for superoxide dismutase, chloroplastic n=1 Tax=Phalaenopsis equestris TaxID=78828 RepID=UPI0009E410CB|nr:copper chaperone for superoxide dismutase, chloroplastic [Phalaenopsis equestris]
MVSFVRTLTTASLVPAALAVAAYSHSTIFTSPRFSFKFDPPLPTSLLSASAPRPLVAGSNQFRPIAALHMESVAVDVKHPDEQTRVLPELMTEFMVDMTCEGCVSAVKNNLLKLEGVRGVEVDLSNQVVRVFGSTAVKTMLDALEQTGRNARLIGQGNPNDFLVSSAVAEFKGPVIFGVVRLAQVNMQLARIEASFSGLSPGKHSWSINEYGDLTRGAESTGKTFNPANNLSEKPLGDLGTLEVAENGDAHFSGSKKQLIVSALIGRSIAVYEKEDKSDSGIAAAVIARSAGVGQNYKKICTCDGVTIWEST